MWLFRPKNCPPLLYLFKKEELRTVGVEGPATRSAVKKMEYKNRMGILVVTHTHTHQISLTSLSSPGFVDLQTEKSDLMENVGTIPFLDYKHFASRIFFPEVQQSSKPDADDSESNSKATCFLPLLLLLPSRMNP